MRITEPTDRSIPCLICDKDIAINDFGLAGDDLTIANASFDSGIHCHSYGNYGSQVLDSSTDSIEFGICDGCVIKNTHKMLYRENSVSCSSAFEHYRVWFSRLFRKLGPNDHYVKDISPYFEDIGSL